MRLYLSSFGFGNKPDRLATLAGKGKRAVHILNALDNRAEVRARFLADQEEQLVKLGFDSEELDLRCFFEKPNQLESLLREKDLVWINGGNAFILRRAMRQSGFDTIIQQLLEENAIVYGGFSAAAVVMPENLRGLDIVDDPHEVPLGYDSEPVWEGLGLLDFRIAVHFNSDHSESALTDQAIEYYQSHQLTYKTLSDGQAMIMEGDRVEIVD